MADEKTVEAPSEEFIKEVQDLLNIGDPLNHVDLGAKDGTSDKEGSDDGSAAAKDGETGTKTPDVPSTVPDDAGADKVAGEAGPGSKPEPGDKEVVKPTVAIPEDERQALSDTIDALRKEIAALAGIRGEPGLKTKPVEGVKTGDQTVKEPEEKPLHKAALQFPELQQGQDVEYLNKEALDTILDKPALLNPILNNVRRSTVESIMLHLPSLVVDLVDEQIKMNKTIDVFYSTNTDLDPYRDFVAHVAAEIEKEKPDLGLNKILEETAKVSRERLRLFQQTKDVAAEKPTKPQEAGLIGKKGARTVVPKAGENESEFEKEFKGLLGR
jgi:hypothetical protein